MQRYLWMPLFLVMVAITPGIGCEICGCGNSNFQIGLLPSYQNGFVGLRYTTSEFRSRVRENTDEFSHDRFKMAEVWGGYSIGRIQIMGFVSYFSSKKVSDDGTTSSSGMGDATVLVNYRLVSSVALSANERTSVRHDVFLGGGIKLPTGVSHVDTANPDFNIGDFNSQAGTGSVDYLLNATHHVAWNNSGIVTNAAYRFNTANSQGYRFGNRAYLNMAYYYTFSTGKTKIKPNTGVNYQSNAINTFQGGDVDDSQGYILNAALGVNVLRNKVGVNATAFMPVAQNMYDYQTKLSSKFQVGVTYSF